MAYYLNENDREILQGVIGKSRIAGPKRSRFRRHRGKPGRGGKGEPSIQVKITTSIPGAVVDPETGVLSPEMVTVIIIAKDDDGNPNVRSDISTEEREVASYFKTFTGSPGSGKFRFGLIDIDPLVPSRYKLIQRECELFDEPEVPSS
jgi:hypothetical protein